MHTWVQNTSTTLAIDRVVTYQEKEIAERWWEMWWASQLRLQLDEMVVGRYGEG
jgi:hypothetical protein